MKGGGGDQSTIDEAREKRIELRKKMTVHKEDQGCHHTFYRHLRPIAVVGLLLGSLPLSGMCGLDGRNLRHRWLGLRLAWDVVLFAAAGSGYAYMLLHAPDDRWQVATLWYDSSLINLMPLVLLVHGVVQFLLCHLAAPKLPPLLTKLEEVYQCHGVSGRIERTLRTRCICIFIVMLLAISYSVAFGTITLNTLEHPLWKMILMVLCYLFITTPVTVALIVYSFLVLSLEALFSDARQSLEEVLDPKVGSIVDDDKLCEERLWYAELCGLVSKLEVCFGAQILANTVLIQAEMVLEIYILFVLRKSTDVLMMTFIVYHFSLAFFVVYLTTKISTQENLVLKGVRSVPITKLTANGQFEVQRFMNQIIARPARISAAGYFLVDKTLVKSIIHSVATYLIVLISFSPHVMKQVQQEKN